MGALVEAFIVAQRHFLATDNDRLIPHDEWEKAEIIPEIMEVGLAEKREKGVYVCGSEDQFSWLVQRSEAGRIGGLAKRKKKVATATSRLAPESGSKPLTLSLPLTLNTNTNTKREMTSQSSVPRQEFIETYSKALKSKYGDNAKLLLTPKIIGQINRLVKDIGITKASDLIQVYFQMDNPWFLKKSHDFGTFIANLQAVALSLDTGKNGGTTGIDWNYVFGGADNDAS